MDTFCLPVRSSLKLIKPCLATTAVLFLFTAVCGLGQITNVTNDQSTPMPGVGHDYIGILNETVSPSNGSLSIRIAVPTPAGRGPNLPFSFSYNSNGVIQIDGNLGYLEARTNMDRNIGEQGGWSYGMPMLSAMQENLPGMNPQHPQAKCPVVTGFVFTDSTGSRHALPLSLVDTEMCNSADYFPLPDAVYNATDGFYDAFTTDGAANLSTAPFTVFDKDGTLFHFSVLGGFGKCNIECAVPDFVEDRNGNVTTISSGSNGYPQTVTDATGRQSLLISSYGAATGDTVSVSGQNKPYTVTWGTTGSNFTIPATIDPSNNASNCGTTVSSPSGGGSIAVITAIKLPNGNSYSFSYDSVSGLLKKITYPTGAYVSYVWGPSDAYADNASYVDSFGNLSCAAKYKPFVVKQRTVFDGANTSQTQTFIYSTTWQSNGSVPWVTKQTTVTTKDMITSGNPSFSTVYNYSPYNVPQTLNYQLSNSANEVPLEQSIVYKGTSGSVLRTVSKSWVPHTSDFLQSETTTLENGQTSKVSYVYTDPLINWDNIAEKDETDFGTNTPGAVLRKTKITYASFADTPFSTGISDRPCKVQVQDGSGNTLSETDTLYDGGTAVCGAAGSAAVSSVSGLTANTHDETNYSPSQSSARGNATSVTQKCLVSGCSDATTTFTYDETGQVLTIKDPCGNPSCADIAGANHTTNFYYDDNYASGAASGHTNSYLTKVTKPVVGGITATTQYAYNYADGQLAWVEDENSQTTTNKTNYSYDATTGRLTSIQGPPDPANLNQRPQTSIGYNDSAAITAPYNPSTTTSTVLNTIGTNKTNESDRDPLGRSIQVQLTSDPTSSGIVTDTVLTTYDGFGRVASTTNPYRSTTSTTDGTTTYTYDSLGRKLSQVDADGVSIQSWTYTGSTVKFKDEAGNQWQRTSDALGRLIQVLEPNGSSQSPSMETDYNYDLLDNLIKVNQLGTGGAAASRIRSFSYDGLSRLLCASNPENSTSGCPTTATVSYTSGTTGYSYDANGNVSSKIDARGLTTTYLYDSLNRLIGKHYNDGTPTACYQYDAAAISGGPTAPNLIGHLSAEWTQAAASCPSQLPSSPTPITAEVFLQYNLMGRLKQEKYCTPQSCNYSNSVSAAYDLAGNTTAITYPDGRVVSQGFDSASRLSSVNYASWNSTSVNSTYLMINSYDPVGHPTATTWGNGTSTATTYNNRLQLTSLAYNSGASTPNIWAKNLTWTTNGNLQFASDTVAGTTRQYAYDTLNRLILAQDIAGTQSSTGQSTDGSYENTDNLVQDFQGLGSEGWNGTTVTMIPNAVSAPDGTMTATSIVAGSTDSAAWNDVPNSNLYSASSLQGSVWLRVPSGTLTTNIYIVSVGTQGWMISGQQQVNLTTTWQQFYVNGTSENGLSNLNLQVGGGGTFATGQTIYMWGPQLQVSSTDSASVTNILPYSQQWSPLSWATNDTIAQNAPSNPLFTAPDSTSSGFEFTGTSSDSYVVDHVQNPGSYSGATVTGSVYLRLPSGTHNVNLYVLDVNAGGASIITTQSVALTTSWQRFQITGTTGASLTDLYLQIGGAGSVASGQKFDVWGAQIEVASTAGQYVATLDSPITVTADSTNILPSSNQAGYHGWAIAAGAFNANTVTAPDGTLTGDTASSSGANTYLRLIANNPELYDGQQVTASIYMAVPSGTRTVTLKLANVATSGGGTVASVDETVTTTWQRFDVTGTLGHGLTNLFINIGGGTQITSGNPLYLWGGQMVMGSDPGAVISTNNTTTNVATGAAAYLAAYGMDQSYSYDPFGNMVSAGNFNFQQAYTTANQLSGWNYDASGNLLNDGLGNGFTYDAEGRISTASNYIYVSDAGGVRVSKETPNQSPMPPTPQVDYFNFGGHELARLSGGQWTDLIYGVSGLLAEVPGTQTGTPIYRMNDHLGSGVGTLSSAGTLLTSTDYAPFGQIFTGGTTDPYKFTGKERDGESGKDYFGARYYGSSMGRFMSPDWAATPTPVPYADLTNPQRFNLYSYAANNPTTRTDADGHDDYNYNQSGQDDGDPVKRSWFHNLIFGDTYTLHADDGKSYSLDSKPADLGDYNEYNIVPAAQTGAMMSAFVGKNAPLAAGMSLSQFKDASADARDGSKSIFDFKSVIGESSTTLYALPDGSAHAADFIGNMTWGYIASAAGFGGFIGHAGAGVQSIGARNRNGFQPGWLWTMGDDPRDYKAISQGYDWYSATHTGPVLVDTPGYH